MERRNNEEKKRKKNYFSNSKIKDWALVIVDLSLAILSWKHVGRGSKILSLFIQEIKFILQAKQPFCRGPVKRAVTTLDITYVIGSFS